MLCGRIDNIRLGIVRLFIFVSMSSSKDREEAEKQAIKTCTTNQCMIDFTAKHLNGLRIECEVTEEITQKEIREAEVSFSW